MNQVGLVLNTFSAKKGESGLPRPMTESLDLIYKFGIKEDKFAGKDEEKSVMIVGRLPYEIARNNSIFLEEGSLGENILLDFNPHDYNIGTVLKIGNTQLEITQSCTICNHLSKFNENLPHLVEKCRGLYCKILEGGNIEKGMYVTVLKGLHNKILHK